MNRSFRANSGFASAVLVSVALLLGVLAVIQFRWIDKLAAAERQRLQSDIEMTALRAHESWYREIMHAAMTFGWLRVAAMESREDALAFVKQRHRSWKATSIFPLMVKRVVLAERIGPTVALSELDPAAETFESKEWPQGYAVLRRRLEKIDRAQAIQSQFDEASVIVGAVFVPPSAAARTSPSQTMPAWSAVLVEFDEDYIRSRFLPELIRSHFTMAAVGSYDVVVLDAAGKAIYPAGGARLDTPDVRIGLYDRPLLRSSTAGDDEAFPRSTPPPGHQDPELVPLPTLLRWQLLASYQAGSVDAAVQPLRWRNQLVSLAILSTLAAAIIVTCMAAARMRQFAKLQVEYIAGVSHELRTPLAVIRTGLYNISSGAITGHEQIRDYTQQLEEHTDRLTHMVEQVLLYARTQAGNVRYDRQPVALADVVEHALQLLSSGVQQSGAVVTCDVDPGLPPVAGDSTALTHCVQNVLSNAIKYSNGTPLIGIEATTDPANDAIDLTIVDHGIGIAPADLPHVFEPFYRGVHPAISGAGLGLSLVKQMIERQNGRVVVDSGSSGTRVTLRIPIAHQAVRRPHDAPLADPAH